MKIDKLISILKDMQYKYGNIDISIWIEDDYCDYDFNIKYSYKFDTGLLIPEK